MHNFDCCCILREGCHGCGRSLLNSCLSALAVLFQIPLTHWKLEELRYSVHTARGLMIKGDVGSGTGTWHVGCLAKCSELHYCFLGTYIFLDCGNNPARRGCATSRSFPQRPSASLSSTVSLSPPASSTDDVKSTSWCGMADGWRTAHVVGLHGRVDTV
jgi:hypothetical protein